MKEKWCKSNVILRVVISHLTLLSIWVVMKSYRAIFPWHTDELFEGKRLETKRRICTCVRGAFWLGFEEETLVEWVVVWLWGGGRVVLCAVIVWASLLYFVGCLFVAFPPPEVSRIEVKALNKHVS